MTSCLLTVALFLPQSTPQLGPGDHFRSLMQGTERRTYLVHIPKSYDSTKPTPVVLALHGMAMNARIMELFSGLSEKADKEGFIVVYPNGTGPGGVLLSWNTGAFAGDEKKNRPDDVGFIANVLDDIEATTNVDRKRIYVTGMSNGAMMTYRLACEMSERIAAVAPVAGTMAEGKCEPKRPVPVLHFHGTDDGLVPYRGVKAGAARVFRFRSVEDTVKTWAKINGCEGDPTVTELPTSADKLLVTRRAYDSCKGNADVILYQVTGGGHSWPGRQFQAQFLGASTENISANDLMWDFFQKHPLK